MPAKRGKQPTKLVDWLINWCFPSPLPQEHFGHFMARPHHKWPSDGTIWTNGTIRHSGNQKKTICWSHSATRNNQTSHSGLRMDTRRWQEEGRTTKEDMARHTERRFGILDTLGVDWSDARDTANDRARWRQLVAQCSAQNGRTGLLILQY